MKSFEKEISILVPVETAKGKIQVASRDTIDGLIRDCHGKQKNVICPMSVLADPVSNIPSDGIIELTDEVSDSSSLSDAYGSGSILDAVFSATPSLNSAGLPKSNPLNERKLLIGRIINWIRRG